MKTTGITATLMVTILAFVSAFAQAAPPTKTVKLTAELFPLKEVRITGGPFQKAMDVNRAYLLRLEPDRLLSYMRKNAGLTPKAAPYGGWDSGGSGSVGHYLSACSLLYAATGDSALKKRVDYLVAEMAECQRAAGDGGLYSYEWDKNAYFAKLKQGDLVPVPVTAWYVTHKTMAGLRDAYLETGSLPARAALIRLCNWAIDVTAKLTPAQWQTMLDGEHGGPHEVLADVYAFTGERKYLELAEKFRHERVFGPLAKNSADVLAGLHANTQIPKFIAYERIYELTGDSEYHAAAKNFFSHVTQDYSWANGSNSQWERFFPKAEFETKIAEVCGPETCNTYNMLKLAERLYTIDPKASFADYYENALWNHILPSLQPETAPDRGGFVYYTPMRPGHYRVFSNDFNSFWCCVGTGMENPGRYAQMIYAHSADSLYVNLFLPSKLTWAEKGMTLTQTTTFPETPRTILTLTLNKPTQLTLNVRYPAWVAPGKLKIAVNGKSASFVGKPGEYAPLTHLWKSGDTVEIVFPMRLTAEPLPESGSYIAYKYGPILLAGALGADGLQLTDFHQSDQLARKAQPLYEAPAIAGTLADAPGKIRPFPGKPLTFTLDAKPAPATLIPFYRLFDQRYAIYWRLADAKTVDLYQARRDAAEKDRATLQQRTIDRVTIADDASEKSHNLVAENSRTGNAPPSDEYTKWRDAAGFFRYTLALPTDGPAALRIVYWGGDAGRTFTLLADNQPLATQRLIAEFPGDYFAITYPLPPDLTKGKTQITLEFRPAPNSVAGGVFDIRMVKKD